MLAPDNLTRYGAHWLAPDPTVADVVDQYWHVSWNLGDQSVDQRIIDAPAVTLTVEEGDVPAPRPPMRRSGHGWLAPALGERSPGQQGG